jgi:hypothetical protein
MHIMLNPIIPKAMDKYVFFGRKEDAAPINKHLEELIQCTPEQLIETYNKTVDLGFVGSREQARRVIALHNAMKRVMGYSPITILDNAVIVLGEKIKH